MQTAALVARQFREAFFGGNWTAVNFRDTLSDVGWETATRQVYSLNTIATLVYHCGYYISAVLGVLQGEALTAKDKYSFDHPPVQSEADWQQMLHKVLSDASKFADVVETLTNERLNQTFADEKYGTYYRNLHGIIEHTHYHLGQIVILKKILKAG